MTNNLYFYDNEKSFFTIKDRYTIETLKGKAYLGSIYFEGTLVKDDIIILTYEEL
jgi:hypothetical protein